MMSLARGKVSEDAARLTLAEGMLKVRDLNKLGGGGGIRNSGPYPGGFYRTPLLKSSIYTLCICRPFN